MNTLTIPAPAKLNLFLHITGRRPDGYHELQTLFALLDYGDRLHISAADELRLDADADTPASEDNLVWRAARLLQHHTGTEAGAALHLDKRLPVGGGLGGGSSDAASTLLGLNRFWGLDLQLDTLADLGLELGADVPVFVRGHSAWAEGVGEQLTPVELPDAWYLVVHPGVRVSTGAVFNDPQLTRQYPKSTLATFLGDGPERFDNHCEPVARRLFPAIGEALDQLRERAGNSRLTGTGACVFARVPDEASGARMLAALPSAWSGFVARGINRSPALDAAGFNA
jgi:4-diphosphocytidyl-2-C-methyl-D-erythritol kinase